MDTTKKQSRKAGLFEPGLVKEALRQSFVKLDPRRMIRNPVMFTVEIGTAVMLVVNIGILAGNNDSQGSLGYNITVFLILLVTLLFANFAEAIAEARGKAQAQSLRSTREETPAKLLKDNSVESVTSSQLRKGDLFVCEAGDIVPCDGEIIEGLATIDESAITGESAPVIRESGGDRSGVTGGTRVLSDRIVVRVSAGAGESFLDKMIALVEGASRQKTPNEIALTILLAAFTLVFIIVTVTLKPFADYAGTAISIAALISLFVCLIPTTIGGLLSAIGIAGMDRALKANVIAKSGKAVETAGDIDVLLLDKTGTITYGDRQAVAFHALASTDADQLRQAALLASLADPTPEGKSVVKLAREQGERIADPDNADFVPFSTQTRMSGVDLPGERVIRKGSLDAIAQHVQSLDGHIPAELQARVAQVARTGATPLVVSDGRHVLGVIELSDVIKHGIKERFARLREMGIKTVMITGDNKLTAASIAAEAGVDDYIAEARPEDKLARIRAEQASGRLVAMVGDGTNDAPALAQADIGLAMNSGTQAAKEAGNMVDLDSDPTKLLAVVEIGKQQLITRGALTTFSLANDVSKYFAILPALFAVAIPQMTALNVMHLSSPNSAVLSALIFNAVIIPLLIPLALRGVRFKPASATALLRNNMLVYGMGGILLPFIAIKLIDVVLSALFNV